MIPSVRKGEKFKPSAAVHNEIAETINRMNGFQGGNLSKGQSNEIRIAFINTFDEEMPAGAPVVIDSYNAKLDLFTIRKFQNEDIIFGVAKNTVKSKEIGTAILNGIVKISVKGTQKKYIYPVVDKFGWEYSDYGIPVLCSAGDDSAIIFVGTSLDDFAKNKNRPFWCAYNSETNMIDISGGWVIGNGEKLSAKPDSLGVQNGYICVTSELAGINYKEPTFKYGEFAPNSIPIAFVSVTNDIVQIVNFYVSTAVFLETNLHPPCECLGE
jgi:hypothetical protein